MMVLNVGVSVNTSWEWLVIISRKLNLVYHCQGVIHPSVHLGCGNLTTLKVLRLGCP